MKTTPNYLLNQPEPTDYVNIADLNDNAGIVDAEMKDLSDRIDFVSQKVTDNFKWKKLKEFSRNNTRYTNENVSRNNLIMDLYGVNLNNCRSLYMKVEIQILKSHFGTPTYNGWIGICADAFGEEGNAEVLARINAQGAKNICKFIFPFPLLEKKIVAGANDCTVSITGTGGHTLNLNGNLNSALYLVPYHEESQSETQWADVNLKLELWGEFFE